MAPVTPGLRRRMRLAALWVFACVPAVALAQVPERSVLLEQVGDDYGRRAQARVEAWLDMMARAKQSPVETQLRAVNDFINERVRFVQDPEHWNAEDYWATPLETFGTGAGDCEDLAIAKYVSLRRMGVPDEQLRITYVRAAGWDLPHMVLAWYESPGAEPLVLDNLNGAVLPASKRGDLTPVYSFNAVGLWIARGRRGGNLVGSSDRIGLWKGVVERMNEQGLDLAPAHGAEGGKP